MELLLHNLPQTNGLCLVNDWDATSHDDDGD